ncbi:O-acetyl-ADP-ribose deacetylase [Paenibacillus sp. GSMTC-2017]|uniref:O-acetyl-ADP-ribose deacetylase n=1 Tax=Paenibacillus sp. GSMTC-2017 TaxID=2794350 RepID=UPI002FBDFD47
MEIQLMVGDITKVEVDAIVNAANTSLLGGGGVDGAIHKAGGKAILEACMKIRDRQGGCSVGEAVITPAGLLKARFVIHTVGPVWNDGRSDEESKLSSCYSKSLAIANQNGVESIAFPGISTGIYRFPKDKAATIALDVVRNYILKNSGETSIKRFLFVCFDSESYDSYQSYLMGL